MLDWTGNNKTVTFTDPITISTNKIRGQLQYTKMNSSGIRVKMKTNLKNYIFHDSTKKEQGTHEITYKQLCESFMENFSEESKGEGGQGGHSSSKLSGPTLKLQRLKSHAPLVGVEKRLPGQSRPRSGSAHTAVGHQPQSAVKATR